MVNDVIVGYLQDKEALSWAFPKEKCGRRAPWVVTHIPLLAAVVFMAWSPPETAPPCQQSADCGLGRLCLSASNQFIYGFNESAAACPNSECFCVFERELRLSLSASIHNYSAVGMYTTGSAPVFEPVTPLTAMQMSALRLDPDLLVSVTSVVSPLLF